MKHLQEPTKIFNHKHLPDNDTNPYGFGSVRKKRFAKSAESKVKYTTLPKK